MGVAFDVLCQILEHTEALPKKLRPLVEEAKLFHFPGKAHEVLAGVDFASEDMDAIGEMFFLPFPVMVIEDGASAVLLADFEEDAMGINQPRFFLECQQVRANSEEFFDSRLSTTHDREAEGLVSIVWGTLLDTKKKTSVEQKSTFRWSDILSLSYWREIIRGSEPSCNQELDLIKDAPVELETEAQILGTSVFIRQGRLDEISGERRKRRSRERKHWVLLEQGRGENLQEIARLSVKNTIIAMQEVAMYNLPKRWIVEKTRSKLIAPRAGMIPRTEHRPVYHLMELCEFREQIGERPPPKGSGQRKTHDRRAHPRFLKSARYTQMQGTWIRVKASVVGRTEGTSADRKWNLRVLTDR